MKKGILMVIGGLLASQMMAQSVTKSELEPINKYQELQSDLSRGQQSKRAARAVNAAGDTAWIEDFANGIPAGWILGGADATSCPWTHSLDGSKGFFNGGNYPNADVGMNSASAANGFLLCDPDSANNALYGQPSGSTYQYLESNITTSAIDLSLFPSVRLEFEQSFRYNNAPDMEISVSTDGTNWTIFEAKGDITANQASPDPMTFSIDVSSIVGGSSTAYIRIGWSARVYFWMIDDIRFTVPPANDLVLDGAFYRTVRDTGISNYYTRVPISQAIYDTLQFSGNVSNTGSASQLNAKLTNTVVGPSVSDTMTSNMVDLAVGTSDSLIIMNNFTFNQGIGNYAFSYKVSSDSIDNNPGDNALDTFNVNVTDTTYSRDLEATGNYWFGAGTTYEIGPLFDIYETVKVTSVSIAVGSSSEGGEAISIYIYDGSLTTPISSREFIILDSATVGSLVTYSMPEVILTPGQYIVTYKTYTDKVLFRRSSFEADPLTCFIDVDGSGTFGWTTAMPAVRLNVSTNLHVCDLKATAVQTGDNAAMASYTGGFGNVTYAWSNGVTTAAITGVSSEMDYTVRLTDDTACTSSASVRVVTGVIEAGIEGSVSVYPNPNNGDFQLSLENVYSGEYMLAVRNIIGQTVYQDVLDVSGNYDGLVSLSNLESGIYFLDITNSNGEKSVIKFIVE